MSDYEKHKLKNSFGYENLQVLQKAIEFAVQTINLIENLNTPHKHYRLIEQLEASSSSVSMNLAEGKMAATAQKIYEKALKLPEPLAKEILDFIGYIEMKYGLKDVWADELIKAQVPVMDQIWSSSEDDVWNDL